MKSINIEINGKEYLIKQSFRTYLLYEEMTKKQISDIQTFNDMLTLLYCTFKGCNKDFTYSFDEFIDVIDDNPEIFTQFNEFNNELVEDTEKKTKGKD